MGPIIQELLFCLLPAAAIGTVVGWMLKKLTVEEQQVGITRFELEVKLTAAERKLQALQKELDGVHAGAQSKTSQASIAADELANLKAQLGERDEHVHALRTRIAALEGMPVKVATQEATIADLESKLLAFASLPDTLTQRDHELTSLREQLNAMVSKQHLDAQETQLQERISTLERDLAEAKSVAVQEEAWARQVLGERDGTIEHLHEELARFQRSVSDLSALKNQLSEREETIASLREEVIQAQGLQEERDTLDSLVRTRDAELTRMQQLVADAEQEAQQAGKRVRELEARAQDEASLRAMIETAERRLAERDEDVQRLTDKLTQMVPIVEVERLQAKLNAARVQGERPQRVSSAVDPTPVEPQAELVSAASAPSPRVAQIAQAEMFTEAVSDPSVPKWGATPPPERAGQDDLKRIWGVGPALERLLHQQGIFYFRQIASWTKDDIQTIDQKLDTFKGRILRDDWITGAKEEHFRKYGERL